MTDTPIDVGDVAARLALAVGRINRRARPGNGALSYGLVSALSTIVRLGPLRAGDLARLEVVTKPTMTRVLSDLETRGLIERVPDPKDGRAAVLSATPAGVQAVHEARHERAGIVADLLSSLDEAEVRSIAGALDALERVGQIRPSGVETASVPAASAPAAADSAARVQSAGVESAAVLSSSEV